MAEYLSYAGRHSIQEVVIAIHFLRGVASPAIVKNAFVNVQADLKQELPLSNVIQMTQFNIDAVLLLSVWGSRRGKLTLPDSNSRG